MLSRKKGSSEPGTPELPKLDVQPDRAVTTLDSYTRADYLTTNPDDLINKKGYEIYDEMLRDPQVHSVTTIKKVAILSAGWRVYPASLKPADVMVSDYVRWSLVHMPGAFTNIVYSMLSALDYGFSMTEKNWYVIDDNRKYAGLVGIKSLKPKSPHAIDFQMDKHGNILPNGVSQWLNDDAAGGLPYNKFMHFAYNSSFGNPYGRSDLRAAYKSWLEKKMINMFWNVYLERFGSPTIVANIPNSATADEKTKIQLVMNSVQTKSGITLPEGFTMDTLEAKRSGVADYEAAIAAKNREMAHAMLMPDLMGFTSGPKSGSFALGKTQGEMFNVIIDSISRMVENVINEQLIKELVNYNFVVQDYPRFFFDPLKRENRSVRSKLMSILIDSGVVKPNELWIREFIEIPDVGVTGGKQEEQIDDPILGEKLDEIEKIKKEANPRLVYPPTTTRVGSSDDTVPSIETLPWRSEVEVQEPKL